MNRKSRVLIADGNAANRDLLESYLVQVDYDILLAVDGQDALDKAKSFQPDLIVIDVMMPKLSGIEVCRRLKDDPQLSKIKVLMVTALSELGDIEGAIKAGTDDFLSKPVNKLELLNRVKLMLLIKDTTEE